MRSVLAVGFLSSLLMAVGGCGTGSGGASGEAESSASSVVEIGPHRGPVLSLPDGSRAEVVAEVVKAGTDPVIAVYYLKSTGGEPLKSAPGEAKVVIGGEEHALSAQPSSTKDSSGAVRTATRPLAIDPDRVAGELVGTAGGKPFQLAFRIGP